MKLNIKQIFLFASLLTLFVTGFISGQSQKKEVISDNNQNPSISISPSSNGLRVKSFVLKVVDGDTIDVLINGKSQAVRLIGIDTPEVVDPRKPVQCFGEQASQKAKSILGGKNIFLESDPSQRDKDKYQRLLRYIYLEDGTNFNLMMIMQGFAHEYTYNLPYKYQSEFKAAQKTARQKGIGLWSPDTCSGNTGMSSTAIKTSESNSVSQAGDQSSLSQGTSSAVLNYKPTGVYSCDCSKLCGQIKTCDEAYYQLQNCGCSARDSDGDGIPCESLCK